MIENDFNTSASRVLNHDSQAFPQRSYSLPSTSVRMAVFNCCHSCKQSQSLGCAVNNIARTLLLIAVHCVALVAPSGTARDLRILLHCDALDLDFCTLMTVLDRRAVNVRSFSNSCTWMCSCTSHLETRLAPGVIRGIACSLVIDPFCRRYHSFHNFSLVFVLSSFEVSQHSSHSLQLAFQHQGSYGMCISRLQKAYNVECVLISFS